MLKIEMMQKVAIDIPAAAQYLSVIGACVRAMFETENGLNDREMFLYQIELAVHEVCVNIIEHAYAESAGRIAIQWMIEENPRRLIVDLYDTGTPFDPSGLEAVNLEEPRIRGYGLFLVRELMDVVQYSTEPGRNHWQLVKNYRTGEFHGENPGC